MNETNITKIELFLHDINATILSDVILSASLPVKMDPNQGAGNALEECSKMLTVHLNTLKLQQ